MADELKMSTAVATRNAANELAIPFANAEQEALFEFWDKVRGNKLAPLASEIDPAQIAPLLKNLAILDVIDETNIPYRLAGTSIAERMNIDPTGMNILDITNEGSREFVSLFLNWIVSQPVGAIAEYENLYKSGKRSLVHSLYLPLAAAGEAAAPRVLSIHASDQTITYQDEQPAVAIASAIAKITWIDIGAGVPDGV